MNKASNHSANNEFARICAQLPDWEREKMRTLLVKLCHGDEHAGLLTRQLKLGQISPGELLKNI